MSGVDGRECWLACLGMGPAGKRWAVRLGRKHLSVGGDLKIQVSEPVAFRCPTAVLGRFDPF
jgi:hypothetical protein